MTAEAEPATLTVAEAAKLLGIGRNQAYEAVQRGEIPSLRIGRRVLIPAARLRRLLEDGPPTPPDPAAPVGTDGLP